MSDASDSRCSPDGSHIPPYCLVVVPLLIILLWSIGLGLASWWFWTEGLAQTSPTQRFLLVAALFGALGGMIESARGLWKNVFQIWEKNTGHADHIHGSPLNNFVVRPILWPIPGAVLGVAFAAILLDEGTNLLKVALLGTVGGLLWQTIQKKLPEMLGLTNKKDR